MLLELKKKALEFWESLKLPDRQYKTLIDLGVISQITENFTEALVFFKRAFNIAYTMNDLERMYFSQGFIGECLLKQKEIEKANFTYLQAFKLAVFINSTNDFKDEVIKMRLILQSLGNSKELIMEEEQKALQTPDSK
jgi:tetratricopeptide (TPR) repeat protein